LRTRKKGNREKGVLWGVVINFVKSQKDRVLGTSKQPPSPRETFFGGGENAVLEIEEKKGGRKTVEGATAIQGRGGIDVTRKDPQKRGCARNEESTAPRKLKKKREGHAKKKGEAKGPRVRESPGWGKGGNHSSTVERDKGELQDRNIEENRKRPAGRRSKEIQEKAKGLVPPSEAEVSEKDSKTWRSSGRNYLGEPELDDKGREKEQE